MSEDFQPSAIFDGVLRAVRRAPAALAVQFKGRDWSYESLLQASLAGARRLNGLGVRPGDRVAFLARNSDAYLIGWLATQALGAIHVPINFMLGAEEIAYILGHAAPRVLYAGPEFAPTARAAASSLEAGMVLRDVAEFIEPGEAASIVAAPTGRAPQPAQLAYTSGTESAPKGALLTDAGLVHQNMSCIHVGEYAARDVVVHALPLYHCAQMHCFLTPYLFLGGRNIILERADAGEIIEVVQANRATSFFAPPTVWIGILNHPDFASEKLATLTKGYYGASIMPTEVLHGLRRALPTLRVWNFYGQTEIGPLAAALRPEEHDARPASAGRPVLFVETRIVDDDMHDVTPGEIGELVHRSPQLLQSYYRDPVKTAEAFRGGWFHTGDLAIGDAEGYYQIVDRKKDMIKTGGENVASREVEEAIYKHPAVAEVAVIGLPDAKWVERVAAVVVLRRGMSATAEEIAGTASEHLAGFKRPKQIIFADALPKNPSGKILKRDLRLQHGGTADLAGARAS